MILHLARVGMSTGKPVDPTRHLRALFRAFGAGGGAVNLYLARDGFADRIAFQRSIDFGPFHIHRLQLGDDFADRAGVFVISCKQIGSDLAALLAASFG